MIKVLKGSRDHRTKAEQANENSITHLIKTLATRQDKVDLVTERNPLHYMFGEYLLVRNYEEKYEDFISRTYIGERQKLINIAQAYQMQGSFLNSKRKST